MKKIAYYLCVAAVGCGLVACSNSEDDSDLPRDASNGDAGKSGSGAAGSGGSNTKPSSLKDKSILATKTYVSGELQKLVDASTAIQKAAPAADADGWNAKDDAKAVQDMKAAWNKARDAYEHIEGSIAILFSGLDVSTDERYDAFIEGGADDNLFDDEGVTGMHAIERILWAGDHPETVVKFESALDGYKEAAFPSNKTEAEEFKNKLCQKLVDDTKDMLDQLKPLALDAPTAFRGVIGSMNEQLEKVTLATTAEDESRYAQRTLDDMRANLAGGRAVYAAFRDWVKDAAGDDVDAQIQAGFESIASAYAANKGASIPAPPADFDADKPSEADLNTPYGKLYKLLTTETDVENDSALIVVMDKAADEMKLEDLPDEE